MVNITYRINYAVSDELETWLYQQANRVGNIKTGINFTEVVYNHTASESAAFKKELARRCSVFVDGVADNLNKYDDQIVSAVPYYDLTQSSTPVNPPSGVRRVFVNDATGELSVKTSAGATKSLEVADAETTGTATGAADGSATVFNIAHGLGSVPFSAFVQVSSVLGSNIAYSFAVDATNITVTFASAPATGTITFHWRAVA